MNNAQLTGNVISFLNGFIVGENTPDAKPISHEQSIVLQCELIKRGYMLSNDAMTYVATRGLDEVTALYNDILKYIDSTICNGNFVAFYQGFPAQVQNMSRIEQMFNQFMHYYSDGEYMPDPSGYENKLYAFEKIKYKEIQLEPESELLNVFTKITSSPVALSDQEVKTFEWFLSNYKPEILKDYVSKNITFKELMCKLIDIELYSPKTVTDVLRYAMYISGGDVSLPTVPKYIRESRWSSTKTINPLYVKQKFKSFTRAERRKILGFFEQSNLDVREMKSRVKLFIGLGAWIHPGEKKHRALFPKTAVAFDTLRNDKVTSWYGEVDACESLEEFLDKLSERPGEFARRLDHLLRNCIDPTCEDMIFESFIQVADKISMKVLFELIKHFSTRTSEIERSIFIKASNKAHKLEPLPVMNKNTVARVIDALKSCLSCKFAAKGKLENTIVVIDERLRNIPVPLDLRNLTNSLNQRVRGQKIEIPDKNTIRFYLHWIDERGHYDLDLSAAFLDAKKSFVDYISYATSLDKGFAVHSGDVRRRRGNCAEYIDINRAECLEKGLRYVIPVAYNFDGCNFEKISAATGFMGREYPDSNTNWLPETLEHASNITGVSTSSVVTGIFDLVENTFMTIDCGTYESANSLTANSVNHILDDVARISAKAAAFTVFDLIKMQYVARGATIVYDKEYIDGLETKEPQTIIEIDSLQFKTFKDIFEFMQ